MKKFLTLALVALLGVGISDAQLVKSRTFNTVEKQKKGYNRISIAYDAEFFTGKALDESITGNGFNFMYNHGFGLSNNIPIFLEVGVGMGYNNGWKTYYDDGTWKEKLGLNNFWIKVPINVSYKVNLTDKISLLPYTGINFKINAMADLKEKEYRNGDEYDSDSWSLFDEDMGGKRFQMGWQIGLGVNISKLYVGVQYGLDFMPIADYGDGYKVNTSNLAVSVGLTW